MRWRILHDCGGVGVATAASVAVAEAVTAALKAAGLLTTHPAPYLALALVTLAGIWWHRRDPKWLLPLGAWGFFGISLLLQRLLYPSLDLLPNAVLLGVPLWAVARLYAEITEAGGFGAWRTARQPS